MIILLLPYERARLLSKSIRGTAQRDRLNAHDIIITYIHRRYVAAAVIILCSRYIIRVLQVVFRENFPVTI